MEAKVKDLVIGDCFSTNGGEIYRTVLQIYNDYFISNKTEELHCRRHIFYNNSEHLSLDENQEVHVIKIEDPRLADFIAPRMEPRCAGIKEIRFKHQGHYFYPCRGFIFWVRWNIFIFDIRDIRELYGQPQVLESDYDFGLAAFETKINGLLRLIRDKPMKDVFIQIHKMKNLGSQVVRNQ